MSAFHRAISFGSVGEFSLLLGSTQPASGMTQEEDNWLGFFWWLGFFFFFFFFLLSNYTRIAKLLSKSGKRGSEMDLNFLPGVWELRAT